MSSSKSHSTLASNKTVTSLYVHPATRRLVRPVEVFVCVGIVLVLVMVLYPVFAPVSHSSRYSCISQMKQLSMSLIQYAQDFDEHLPIASNWVDGTYPYNKREMIYHCTEFQYINGVKNENNRLSPIYGYAFNSALSAQSIQTDRKPDTLLLCDSNIPGRNANGFDHAALANPPNHAGGSIPAKRYNLALTLDGKLHLIDELGHNITKPKPSGYVFLKPKVERPSRPQKAH